MDKNRNKVFTVVEYTGCGTREIMFLSEEKAKGYAERVRSDGDFICFCSKHFFSEFEFRKVCKKCIDYEKPKKK